MKSTSRTYITRFYNLGCLSFRLETRLFKPLFLDLNLNWNKLNPAWSFHLEMNLYIFSLTFEVSRNGVGLYLDQHSSRVKNVSPQFTQHG